ncbi:MAG: hypothetical protein K2J94_03615, partial [Duncaniella sp.]|nr:hypothetical protein [Duncaniella sp.]
ALKIGDFDIKAEQRNNEAIFRELPLKQGWNKLTVTVAEGDNNEFNGVFRCNNNAEFMPQMKAAYINPETK